MCEMKDSGIEWIGEIPEHWKLIKGKYILKYISKPTRQNDEIITCFRNGEVTLRSNRREEGFTMADKEIGYQGIDIGDLVVHGMDGFAGAIGISDSRGKASPVLNVIDTSHNKHYIMYYLRSMAYNDVFLALATGIRVRSCDLRWNKLAELFYPIPPIEEQQKIADYLDEKCNHIDDIIKELKKQIETLADYKKSLITETVTKGLNPDAKMKDSGIEWIGEIPEHWEVKKLKYITVQRNEKGLFKSNQDIYIGLENVMSYSDTLLETSSEYEDSIQSVCHAGDIMFNKLRPYLAKVIIAPYNCFCTGEFLQFCSFNGDSRFLKYFMLSDRFIKIVNASTYGVKMPRANTDFIINLLMTYPPIEEQKIIADYLDKKCPEIDKIVSEKKQKIKAIEDYKKSLIFEYVTGKRKV